MTTSIRSALRRGGVALLGGTLLASGLALGGPAPASQAHAADPVPSGLAADWLAGELVDGALVGSFGPSWGLTVDAGFALDAVGGHQADVDAITDALAAHITDYVTGESFGDTGSTYAGSTAKAAVFVEGVGADPAAFGGDDLVARLEATVQPSGRIEDVSAYGDFANVIGQSYAARALSEQGSGSAVQALDFLLTQQCGAGWFRQDFTRLAPPDEWTPGEATDAGCNAAADEPSVDTTALAVISLQPLAAGDADVAAAVADAVAWLQQQQAADGSLRLGSIPPNANSTGVAGWAFGLVGEHEAAEKAAGWLRALQFGGVRCDGAARAERGAVAYTASEFRSSVADGVTDRGKVQRAATQAIPALLAAPEGEGTLGFRAPSFLDGGGKARIRVRNLAPGEPACVGIGRFTRRVVGDDDGRVVARVRVPDRSGFVGVVIDTADGSVGTEGLVLAAKVLPLDLRATVAPRGEQRVVVRGLESGERVVVRQDGEAVARGTATTRGRFVATFSAPGETGRHRIKVTGQFADRTGSAAYRVR